MDSLTATQSPSASITTYHCLCSELALASPFPLQKYPQRLLDGARICQILDLDVAAKNTDISVASADSPPRIMLAGDAAVDLKPLVLQLDDGFEKRYTLRCARCALPLGYQLDRAQMGRISLATDGVADGDGVGSASLKDGRVDDVLFLLPDAFVKTEDLDVRG